MDTRKLRNQRRQELRYGISIVYGLEINNLLANQIKSVQNLPGLAKLFDWYIPQNFHITIVRGKSQKDPIKNVNAISSLLIQWARSCQPFSLEYSRIGLSPEGEIKLHFKAGSELFKSNVDLISKITDYPISLTEHPWITFGGMKGSCKLTPEEIGPSLLFGEKMTILENGFHFTVSRLKVVLYKNIEFSDISIIKSINLLC